MHSDTLKLSMTKGCGRCLFIYRRAVEPSTLTRCTATKSFHPERKRNLTKDASTGLTVSLPSCKLPSFSPISAHAKRTH